MQAQTARRPRASFISLWLLALLLLWPAQPQDARAQPSAAPPNAPPAQAALPPMRYSPAHDYDLRHVKLDLRFDWAREQVAGTAALTFTPLAPNLRSVVFDAANMTFERVQTAAGAALPYTADVAAEQLRVELDRAYQPAEVLTVVIAYHTNGRVRQLGSGNYALGLIFNQPTPADPTSRRQIYTQGESEFNHTWFPSYDHPNDFATSELSATVERPFMVISNGQLVETRANADGTRTFHWLMAQPHANYLTSLVVGEYVPVEQSADGVPVVSYVYPDEVSAGQLTTARLADMVRFFSATLGVKYPYAKYAQTMVHNFPGGMENISATTQTDTMMQDARAALDGTSDSLQAHELAHQWFGDYVTSRDWSDLWLNEGFATYLEGVWTEHQAGRDEFLYSDIRVAQDAYLDAWWRGLRRPVVTKNYRDPEAVFDVYSYQRPGATLHMLRFVLGEANWWRALNHYLTKYAHQPVETEQFRIAIEEATGQPLDWFFDEWIYRMGHPVLRVAQQYDAARQTLTLRVQQEQRPDPTNPYPQTSYFRMPVEVEVGTASGTRIERVQLAPVAAQTFEFKLDGPPLLVNFDYGRTLIKELHFDKSTDELRYQLAHDADVLGRTWALEQMRVRLRQPDTNEADQQRIVAALTTALTTDQFWGVRYEAAGAVAGLRSPGVRAALLAATTDTQAKVRARAFAALSASHDIQLASRYEQGLHDPSYAVVGAAAEALGQTKAPPAYAALTKLLAEPSWREHLQVAALNGLAALGDPRALELGLRYSAPTHTSDARRAAIYVLGATGKGDARVLPALLQTLRDSVASNDFNLATAAAESVYNLDDLEGLRTLRALLAVASQIVGSDDIRAFQTQVEQRLREKQAGGAQKPGPP